MHVFMCYSYIFSKDDGTQEMRSVSDPIREGAEGFLKVQVIIITSIRPTFNTIILLYYYTIYNIHLNVFFVVNMLILMLIYWLL
jgi:Na+/H+-translocating membrane pyrophosphatase